MSVWHRRWLAAILTAIGVLFTCGLVSAVLGVTQRAADILDHFSGFTRDNPFLSGEVPPGGSALEGAERARLLRKAWVKLGDVAVGKDVGHIAIGSYKTQLISGLRTGRLYD